MNLKSYFLISRSFRPYRKKIHPFSNSANYLVSSENSTSQTLKNISPEYYYFIFKFGG